MPGAGGLGDGEGGGGGPPLEGGGGGPGPGGEGGAGDVEVVTEEQRWRKRALEAEALVEELKGKLAGALEDLEAAREALDASERKRQIECCLAEAGAVDIAAARLLTEAAVEEMDAPDVAVAIEDLKRTKGWLFGHGHVSGAGASVMSGRVGERWSSALEDAAEEAAVTGDRGALLRYLRLKRGR
ncbi:MAG: hypothetical protein AB7G17_10200 [Phycisphaerales bacterium]